MSGDRIQVNHGGIELARATANFRISNLRILEQRLQNANERVLGPWKGKGEQSFESLAQVNAAFFRTMINEWQNLTNAVGTSNQEYEQTDCLIAGQMR